MNKIKKYIFIDGKISTLKLTFTETIINNQFVKIDWNYVIYFFFSHNIFKKFSINTFEISFYKLLLCRTFNAADVVMRPRTFDSAAD